MTIETLEERCRRVTLAIGWAHPFMLFPASFVHYRTCEHVPTACVDPRTSLIRLNPNQGTDLELATTICHELLHLLMLTAGRQGARERSMWNIAADMAINQALREFGGAQPLKLGEDWCFPPKGHETDTAEELYDLIKDNPKWQKIAMQFCACELEGMPDSEITQKWREIAAQSQQLTAGTAAGKILARLLNIPPPKVRWQQLLRYASGQARAAHGREAQSWSRYNRRNPPSIILPGWASLRSTLAVVIDTSGSISNDQLQQCVAETVAAAQMSDSKIFLVIHDAAVHFADWLRASSTKVGAILVGRGGTVFAPAYEAVERSGRHIDVMIHLTDGISYDGFPAVPGNVRKLVVGLLGSAKVDLPPRAQTVPIEL